MFVSNVFQFAFVILVFAIEEGAIADEKISSKKIFVGKDVVVVIVDADAKTEQKIVRKTNKINVVFAVRLRDIKSLKRQSFLTAVHKK